VDNPQKPEYGYHYYLPQDETGLGYPRLDVFLSERPTEKHFDPESVRCHIAGKHVGGEPVEIHLLVIEHPWTLKNSYRVTAGSLILRDRKDKTHEAFTFGAELTISRTERQTICSFTSPVPILSRESPGSVSDLLSAEAEILLAERRAAWVEDPAGFDARLAAVEPQQLFQAIVIALRERYRRLPGGGHPEFKHLQHLLDQEYQAIQGRGALESVPALEEIL